jgi:hypothetical protein
VLCKVSEKSEFCAYFSDYSNNYSITMSATAAWLAKRRAAEAASSDCYSVDAIAPKRYRFEVVEEDNDQQQSESINSNYTSLAGTNSRIVKTCGLTDGKSFSMTWAEGDLKAGISYNTGGKEPTMMNGEAAMTMLEFYQKINSSNRTKTPGTFQISNDSSISRVTTSKARPHPKLLLNMGFHNPDEGCTAFGMKVVVPGCRPECKTECSPACGEKSIYLNSADLDKMGRSHKYMLEHANLLQAHTECYNIMQDEIIRCMERMTADSPTQENVAHLVSKITTLDLKKPIMTGFLEECNKRNLTCNINRYALYSFCMGQPESLTWRWQEMEKKEVEKEVELLKVVKEEA